MTTTTKRDWAVGQTVRLGSGFDVHDWTVQAVSGNFAALTRLVTERDRADDREQAAYLGGEYEMDPSEFENLNDDATVFYTVVDWRNGVRGPCDLSGGGWGDGTYTEAECAAMLAEFEAGDLEVSHRNRVPIDVVGEVR
jgi:hypothetical protein